MLIDKNNAIVLNQICLGKLPFFRIYSNNIILAGFSSSSSSSPNYWVLYDLSKILNSGLEDSEIFRTPSGYKLNYDGGEIFTMEDQDGNEDVRLFRLV
jgi:hypothetical protein